MSARDKFVGVQADFWACNDPERLTCEDPITALEEWIDGHLSPGCDVAKEIHEMGDISVVAYEKATIQESDIERVTERALEHICEMFDEDDDYGDPEGEHPIFDAATLAKHRPAFEAIVRALVGDAEIWRCEVSSSVVLTPDEAIEIMRVERPDWFEVSP